MVGNKVDLSRQVLTEEGQKLAQSKNMPFFEVSAKEDIGIEAFMHKIIEDVLAANANSTNKKGIGLEAGKSSNDAKKGCGC